MNKHKKRRLVLYQKLEGAGYFEALTAFHFAERLHNGTRKDGITPEFSHQTEIGLFALLLPDVRYREELLATIALHDAREDKHLSFAEVHGLFHDPQKAIMIANAVDAMTKKWRGEVRDEKLLFERMAQDPIASLAKGCDRQHNILSMGGVFSPEKQRLYIDDVKRLFLPMLKEAKRNFTYQLRSYELLKFNLQTQIDLISAGLDAMSENN